MKFIKFILTIILFLITLLYAESPDYPNSCPSSISIDINTTIDGRIDPDDDIDVLKINIPTNGTLKVYTTWPTNDRVDTYGELKDSSCNTIATDDDSGEYYNFYIEKNVQAGIYYIKISSFNWSRWGEYYGIGDYELHVEFTDNLDKSENNPRDFDIAYQTNINGILKVIGNHNICYKTNRNAQCQDPGSSATNNSVYQYYANVDSDASSYLNSSMATLTLNPDDEVIWAGLFWQARISTSNPNSDAKVSNANIVKFKTPTSNGYVDINCSKEKFNWYYDSSDDVWDYACMAPVTELITSSGDYYVADLQSSEGYNRGAGWSLVVVVKNSNYSFKNITIYDGLIGVYNYHTDVYQESVSSTLSGFYTPQSGDVEANFIFFANESDNGLEDEITITDINSNPIKLQNSINPQNNVINGTISRDGVYVTDRNPNFNNTLGTDIDEFDVSSIFGNGQTETTITVTSKDDRVFLSMYGISIQLYQPKICYEETLYDQNNNELNASSNVQVGDMIRAHLLIRNDDNETAENVKVIKIFDENTTKYVQNSTKVKDVDWNDYESFDDNQTINGVNVTFDDNNLSIGPLGEGTTSTLFKPYSSNPDHIAYLDYNFTIQTDQPISLDYKAFYVFNIAGQTFTFDGPLPKCVDFNNTILPYRPALGTFNVVNENFSGNIDPEDSNDSKNSLYTQIANKPFNVKVLHLDDDKITLSPTSGVVFFDIVDASSINQDNNSCVNANLLYRLPGKDYAIFFGDSNPNTQTSIQTLSNVTIPIAHKNATFRIKYMDWSKVVHDSGVVCADVSNMSSNLPGVPACLDSGNQLDLVFPGNPCRTDFGGPCLPNNHGVGDTPYDHQYGCAECLMDYHPFYVCARDNFAIRPDRFSMDMNASPLIGGRFYNLEVNATKYNLDENTTGYNQTIDNSIDKNGTITLIKPPGCTLPDSTEMFSTSIAFNDGKSNDPTYFRYNNVGDINITISDNEWTQVDQQTKSDGSIDCIANSDSNISVNGKIGCLIKGSKTFKFVPKEFDNNLTLKNFNNGNFTYISNDGNMSADLDFAITAILDNNATATNYTAGCFAKDINYTVRLINDKNLTWSTAIQRIKFFDDDTTSNILTINNGYATFKTTEGNFSSGTANITVKFNFDRNLSIPDNPFIINKNDFNITVRETTGPTFGSDFDRTNDQNATFYFARVHAPDYKTQGNFLSANIYFEVYDENLSDPAHILGTNPKESVDDIYWYINPVHVNSAGQIYNISAEHGKINTVQNSAVSNGIEIWDHTYTGSTYPYKDRMDINASSWLIYNKFDSNAKTNHYYIEFTKTGDWAGIGDTGKVVDVNISQENEKRIEW
ncbi:hypothetical protein [Nitrosophilus kaiyonis]|uniref:hypothetical protein n=1 Tax=Nitrosophilus kaiyonis TaxID=2930200 RepID=UPI00249244FE|nr:hypothetical protein [Nitrosophilus kaiyonis]